MWQNKLMMVKAMLKRRKSDVAYLAYHPHALLFFIIQLLDVGGASQLPFRSWHTCRKLCTHHFFSGRVSSLVLCVCVCVYMCVCVHTCADVIVVSVRYVQACVRTCVHACMDVCVCVSMSDCTSV